MQHGGLTGGGGFVGGFVGGSGVGRRWRRWTDRRIVGRRRKVRRRRRRLQYRDERRRCRRRVRGGRDQRPPHASRSTCERRCSTLQRSGIGDRAGARRRTRARQRSRPQQRRAVRQRSTGLERSLALRRRESVQRIASGQGSRGQRLVPGERTTATGSISVLTRARAGRALLPAEDRAPAPVHRWPGDRCPAAPPAWVPPDGCRRRSRLAGSRRPVPMASSPEAQLDPSDHFAAQCREAPRPGSGHRPRASAAPGWAAGRLPVRTRRHRPPKQRRRSELCAFNAISCIRATRVAESLRKDFRCASLHQTWP